MPVRGISCLTDGRRDHSLKAVDALSGVPALEEPHREMDEPSAFVTQLEEAHTRLASYPPYEPCTPECDCSPDIRNDETLTRYGFVRSRVRSTGEHQ